MKTRGGCRPLPSPTRVNCERRARCFGACAGWLIRRTRYGGRKYSGSRLKDWISRHVRFVLPSPKAVLLVGTCLDSAVDGALVRLCGRPRRAVQDDRRVIVLVGGVAMVRSLFPDRGRNLRWLLASVRTASVGRMVGLGFRADPVHLVLPGPGQRRHQ